MVVNNEDFYIQLIPYMDKHDNWLGNMQVNIITSNKNPIDDDGYNQMFHMCQLISAIVPYMNDNPEIIPELEKYIQEEKKEKEVLKVVEKTGNLIKLGKYSKTNGSA